jgi:hypothetical protein
MIDPLFKSATAASASLKTFEAPRTIFGAGSRFALVFAFWPYRIAVMCNCLALCNLGTKCDRQRGIVLNALLAELAKHTDDILLVAMIVLYNSKRSQNKREG